MRIPKDEDAIVFSRDKQKFGGIPYVSTPRKRFRQRNIETGQGCFLAFANTSGGVLLYGVDEDSEGPADSAQSDYPRESTGTN